MKIVEKWGFGMAPIKTEVQIERIKAAKLVKKVIIENSLDSIVEKLEALSVIKGLFSRSYLQDQWDWFTVWTQLGRPSQDASKKIAFTLKDLRDGLKNQSSEAVDDARSILQEMRCIPRLATFINGETEDRELGQIYILSTRENRTLLKIGYTDRRVEDRVKEINSSTGVIVPYGVRAVWNVRSAKETEGKIHALLDDFRIRKDREFFEMDFRDAFKMIRNFIYEMRMQEEELS